MSYNAKDLREIAEENGATTWYHARWGNVKFATEYARRAAHWGFLYMSARDGNAFMASQRKDVKNG